MYKAVQFTFVFLFFLIGAAMAQSLPKPVAKFSFNNSSESDEVSKKKAKLVGVGHTKDRFNNDNNAAHLFGSQSSYINLGNYPALKPEIGSISLWVKMENVIYAGKGYSINPILLTKYQESNNFYEAYAIYYMSETRKMHVCNTLDSLNQIIIGSSEPVPLYQWYHLTMTFDEKNMSFYVNGELQASLQKDFVMHYNPKDSVLIGSTGNLKNARYLSASVDDIEFYDKVLTGEQVRELYNAPNPNTNKIILAWTLRILGLILIIILVYLVIKFRITRSLQREKQALEVTNKLLETELIVNRALMNPHFVFNSLNTLQNFILKNENDRANNYLVKFSKLIRKTLENNMSNGISLDMEIDLLNRYLELENLRFDEDIRYTLTVDPVLSLRITYIPVMMIQPFVENAIWHGLLKKKGEKNLRITFLSYQEKYVECIIDDDGLGRKNNPNFNLEKKSLATGFVKQRLSLLNKIHGIHSGLVIEDKPDEKGTTVTLILPILNKLKNGLEVNID